MNFLQFCALVTIEDPEIKKPVQTDTFFELILSW